MIVDSAKKQNTILWMSSLTMLLLVASAFLSQKYILLALPIIPVIIFTIFYKPQLIPMLLTLSFFIGLPIREHERISIKFADLIFFLLVCAIFSNRSKEQTEFKVTEPIEKITYIYIAFFISCVISILLNLDIKESVDIATSVWYLISLLEVIVVTLIFSQNRMSYLKETLISTFLIAAFFEQILGLLQYYQLGATSLDNMRGVQGTFTHHAMLGNMMMIAISLFLYRLLNSTTLKLKAMYLGGLLFSVYIMIISGSRSGLVGLIISLVVFTISQFKIKKIYFFYLAVLIVSSFIILEFTPLHEIIKNTVKNEHTRTIDLSSYGRLLIWKGAVYNFVNADVLHKLFGIGFGNYYTITYPFVLFSNAKHAAGAHNVFLHVLTETGIIGFIIFIVLFVTIIVGLIKRAKNDKLSFSMLFATVALLFSGMTQETFWFQAAFGAFWMCYAIFISFCLSDRTDGSKNHNVLEKKSN
jgi:O-antigen ligase